MIFQEPMTSLNPAFTIGDQIGEVITHHFNMTEQEAHRGGCQMDKLEKYRAHIKQLLTEYGKYCPSYRGGDVDIELIFDTEHDHYQLVNVGWHNKKRIHSCFLHIDIKNGKIWIQHNGTEDPIASELVTKGVPKEDIVLGFQSPSMRQHTDFSVN